MNEMSRSKFLMDFWGISGIAPPEGVLSSGSNAILRNISQHYTKPLKQQDFPRFDPAPI